MSNDQLRCLLLRLEAMQHATKQIGADLKSLLGRSGPPFSPLTRSLLGMAFNSLDKSRDLASLCQDAVRDALDADAQTSESEAVLLPYVANFCGSIDGPDEAV